MTNLPPIIASFPRTAAPVSSQDRVELLDVLRGFALLGILLVNMALFSWPIYYLFSGVPLGSGPVDRWATWIVRFFAEGKFYPLFSLLFGLGMAMQMQRAEERSVGFVQLHLRRMIVLLCIGIIHGFFIWEGDILMLYALLGMVLVAFRKCKPKTLAIWVFVCLSIPVVIYGGLWLFMALVSYAPKGEAEVSKAIEKWILAQHELGAQNVATFAGGSLPEIMLQRIKNTFYLYSVSFVYAPVVFAMFLTGIYVGRRGVLKHPAEHRSFLRRVLVAALCIGLPGALLMALGQELTIQSNTMSWGWSAIYSVGLAFGAPALMFVYVSGISLLFLREGWHRKLRILAPVGRMALTNYLLQSIVCTTLFYSYGFGLYGSVGRAAGVGLALGIFLLQIPLSTWWLRRFQFGPAEWFWRSVTYGKRQPMRRLSAAPVVLD